jgi:hypothetical protein
MKPLDLQSERYSATGNLASEGVLNQLGRPGLDRLTVLVREAVQNSWDAKLPSSESVKFGLAGWILSTDQKLLLRNTVFAECPANLGLIETLDQPEDFHVLAIYDRGTSGLGGPTRADIFSGEEENRDFVDFLRNVGQPPDKHLGGGTYGYGKAALYLTSQVQTILVHTHCYNGGRPENRFIASALGAQYKGLPPDNFIYTGRHWWGYYEDGIVEPLTGTSADSLAKEIGLPLFEGEERGTTILLLQPFTADQNPIQAMNHLVTALMLNFWPKMLGTKSGKPSMDFKVSWQGQSIPVPYPGDFPPLQGFVQAMENLKTPDIESENPRISQVIEINQSRSPKQRLGILSLQRMSVLPRQTLDTGMDETSFPFNNLVHHVALMRPVELVVRYLEGPPLPTDRLEYAGIFIVDEKLDRIFAKAEPPTHDDWIPNFLNNSNEKTAVRVALKRIREQLDLFTSPVTTSTKSSNIIPLGAFSGMLGGLIMGAEGPGAAVQNFGGSNNFLTTSGNNQVTTSSTGSNVDNVSFAGNNIQNSYGSGNNVNSGTQPGNAANNQLKGQAENNKIIHGKPKIIVTDEGQLGLFGTSPALFVEFKVVHASGSDQTIVKSRVGAVLDDNNLEEDPPSGSMVPEVLEWVGPDGQVRPGSNELVIGPSEDGQWKVVISIPGEFMVGYELTVQEA